MVKLEFEQEVTFAAEPTDRRGKAAKIEAGTAEWTVIAMDADGNEVVDVFIEANPDNELEATLSVGSTEVTGTVTLRADGDADVDEEAVLIGTASFVVDAPNAVAFSLTAGTPTDSEEETPTEEEPPVEEPVEENPETPVG